MGGGNKKGGAPAAPDFSKLAMVNQSNPFGNVSWGKDANGNLTMNTSMSGPMQGVMNNLYSGLGSASQYDPTKAADSAFDRTYNAYKSRLDPMWANRRFGFDAKMAN